jgi:hypothetical protein
MIASPRSLLYDNMASTELEVCQRRNVVGRIKSLEDQKLELHHHWCALDDYDWKLSKGRSLHLLKLSAGTELTTV